MKVIIIALEVVMHASLLLINWSTLINIDIIALLFSHAGYFPVYTQVYVLVQVIYVTKYERV